MAPIARASERPNVVIIFADDMGYSDTRPFGGEVDTPNLDRLAAGGVRFSQFYNAGRCCPSRAALLTGQYPHAAGIGQMTRPRDLDGYRGRLGRDTVTIAEALRPAGYATYAVGKWQVGNPEDAWPRRRGFDHYYGTPTGGGVYFKDNLVTRDGVFFMNDDERVELPDDWYITEDLGKRASHFIEAAPTDKPLFLYLAHIAPHWPLQAPKPDIARHEGRYDAGWDEIRKRRYDRLINLGLIDPAWQLAARPDDVTAWSALETARQQEAKRKMEVFAAQIHALDRSIGDVVAALERTKRLDDTLLLFLSDNGASAEGGEFGFSRGIAGRAVDEPGSYISFGRSWAHAANTPFRRYKMSTHEGGIATPFIMHWPARLDPRTHGGRVTHQPAHLIDLLPTILGAAGAPYPRRLAGERRLPLPGRNLLPLLTREHPVPRTLYWEHQGNQAVRDGHWKLVRAHGEDWELFNLARDRTEQNDLAARMPGRVKRLEAKWKRWARRSKVLPFDEVQASPYLR